MCICIYDHVYITLLKPELQLFEKGEESSELRTTDKPQGDNNGLFSYGVC